MFVINYNNNNNNYYYYYSSYYYYALLHLKFVLFEHLAHMSIWYSGMLHGKMVYWMLVSGLGDDRVVYCMVW